MDLPETKLEKLIRNVRNILIVWSLLFMAFITAFMFDLYKDFSNDDQMLSVYQERAIRSEERYKALKAEHYLNQLEHEAKVNRRDSMPVTERVRIFTEFLDTAN